MECHKCLHTADIAAGVFDNVPFEKTPCATCTLEDNPESAPVEYIDDILPEQFAEALYARRMPVSVLVDVMKLILALPPGIRDTVCMRYTGMSYREIAAIRHTSVAAPERAIRYAMTRWPLIAKLFPVKAGKRYGAHAPLKSPI
jgi:hypothetical protein